MSGCHAPDIGYGDHSNDEDVGDDGSPDSHEHGDLQSPDFPPGDGGAALPLLLGVPWSSLVLHPSRFGRGHLLRMLLYPNLFTMDGTTSATCWYVPTAPKSLRSHRVTACTP